jgi:hypothetical protein
MSANPTPARAGTRLFTSVAFALAAGSVITSLDPLRAQVSYTTAGSTYLQNFDSLPNTPQNATLGNSPIGWTDDTATPGVNQFSIVGWYLYHPLLLAEGGANGHQRLRIGAGTVNTGGFMSWGASGSTERALGDVGSNTLADPAGPGPADIYIGLRLHNDTGQTLDSFTLSYNGEQWRDGGAATPNAQSMNFAWSTTATDFTNGVFTSEAGLGYSSPVFANTGSGAAVDGNVAGRVPLGPVTVTGLNWAPGTDLWLRWDDINNAGNDHGLGIDDLNFSATAVVPEPSTFALVGMGALILFALRRKKSSKRF